MRACRPPSEVFDDSRLSQTIAGRHHVDAQVEKFVSERGCDPKSGSRIFAIRDDEIDRVLFYEFRQTVPDDGAPRAAKNVTNEENVQRSRSQVLGFTSQERQNRCRELVELLMVSREN
jgi:hypothetical protein